MCTVTQSSADAGVQAVEEVNEESCEPLIVLRCTQVDPQSSVMNTFNHSMFADVRFLYAYRKLKVTTLPFDATDERSTGAAISSSELEPDCP